MASPQPPAGAGRVAAGLRHWCAPRVRARWRRWAGMDCACCRCRGPSGNRSRQLWAGRAPGCAAGCRCSPASASPAPTWAASTSGRASCLGAGAARAGSPRLREAGLWAGLGRTGAGSRRQAVAAGPLNFCVLRRDHPAVIKRRFTSVLVVSSLSPLCVLLWRELTGIQVRRRRGRGQRERSQRVWGRKQD